MSIKSGLDHKIGLQNCAMSSRSISDLFRKFNVFNFARIELIAVLLTDGVNATNIILRLLFQLDLDLNVHPRKSNDVLGYLFLRLSSLQ